MEKKLLSFLLVQVFSAVVVFGSLAAFMQLQESTSPLRLKLSEWEDEYRELQFRRNARRLQRDLDNFDRVMNGG